MDGLAILKRVYKHFEDLSRKKLIIKIANAYLKEGATFDSVAYEFGIAPSTVHNYLRKRLKDIDNVLYLKVDIKAKTNKVNTIINFKEKCAAWRENKS